MFGPEFLLASSLITVLVFAAPVLLVGVGVSYAALRSRDAKADHPDPELGLKVAYHFLLTLGVLIAHAGLTVNLFDLIRERDLGIQAGGLGPRGVWVPPPTQPADDPVYWTPAMRTGWALVTAGVLVAAVFFLAVKLGTNDRRWPAAGRVFVGWRVLTAGVLVVAAVTGILVVQFQKEMPKGGAFELMLATLAVWAPSLAVHVFLMKRVGRRAYYVEPKPRPAPEPPRARAIPLGGPGTGQEA